LEDFISLEAELDSLSPPGTTLEGLKKQLGLTHQFLSKVEAKQAQIISTVYDGQNLLRLVSDAQTTCDQLGSLL
jgi:hypothetical protein